MNCSLFGGILYVFTDPNNKRAVTLSRDDRPKITDTASSLNNDVLPIQGIPPPSLLAFLVHLLTRTFSLFSNCSNCRIFPFSSCFFHIILLMLIHPLLFCFLQFTFYFLHFPSSLLIRLLNLLVILFPLLLYLALQYALIPNHSFVRFFRSLAQSIP